jgi:hypothetical protein
MEDLFAMNIPTPSLSDQTKFTESIQRLENASQLAKENIHTLVNLRTGLLNHTFSSP